MTATQDQLIELPAVPKTRQKNIPIETLIELRQPEKKLSCAQIGKIVGCSKENVLRRLTRYGLNTLQEHKKHEGDILSAKGKMLLSNITDAKIKKASLSQTAVAYGIIKEKELLVRGEATSIVKPLVSFGTEPIDITPEPEGKAALEDALEGTKED